MPDISVIVCTHNPLAQYLQRVLDALATQTLPKQHWELVLIDNASQPGLAPRCDLSWHPRVRTIREDTIGLTPARLRGIDEAEGEILVYVDDDNVLAPDYLETVQRLFDGHASLGAIGAGVLEPEFAITPPPSIEPYLALLALRDVAQPACGHDPADLACLPWGAGLGVTRPVAQAYVQLVGRIDAHGLLDRRGQRLYGNGDVAFSWAASLIGKGFGVFPELRVTHLIRAERLTQQYLLRLVHDSAFSNAVSDYLFHGVAPGRAARPIAQVARLALRAIRRGRFAMQMGLADVRGAARARAFIKQQRLQPLALERRS